MVVLGAAAAFRAARSDVTSDGVAHQQPRRWRIILAFLIAPLVPSAAAATVTLVDGLPNGGYLQWLVLVALIGGYPAALILGLPAFFILRSRLRPRFMYVTFAGGLVAAAPWLLLVLFGPNPDMATSGEHVTVVSGAKTLWGWLEGMRMIGGAFLLGLMGGAAFWFISMWRPSTLSKPAQA